MFSSKSILVCGTVRGVAALIISCPPLIDLNLSPLYPYSTGVNKITLLLINTGK